MHLIKEQCLYFGHLKQTVKCIPFKNQNNDINIILKSTKRKPGHPVRVETGTQYGQKSADA